MKQPITIPPVGESISSAALARWYKADGEWVSEGDLLASLETDKVSNDLLATHDGILRIFVLEGEEIPIGTIIGELDTSINVPCLRKEGKEALLLASVDKNIIPSLAATTPVSHTPKTPPLATPSLAPQAIAYTPTAYGLSSNGRTERIKMTPLRRKISTHLVQAQQTAAILTTFNECNMKSVMELRKELQVQFQERYGVKLGFMSFFIKAVVSALKAVPQLNAQIDGTDIIQQHFYDISVAIGTEKGLVVPVIRDCDKKSCGEIEQELALLAQKARNGTLELHELQGGVFTLSNGGVYGSLLSTPIINPPQSAILGLHTIQERPIAEDGAVVIRPMMYLALSYDHRLVDGKQAVTALIHIKQCIEHPAALLTES